MKDDSNTNQTYRENEPQDLFFLLSETLEAGFEFLLVRESGAQLSLRRTEIEVIFETGKVFIEYPAGESPKRWRIISAKREGNKLALVTSIQFDSEREVLELIPRVTAADLLAAIKEARLEKAGEIAAVITANVPNAKISRIRLSPGIRAGEYGNNAQILLQTSRGTQLAVFAQVAGKGTNPEAFLVSAINWFTNISLPAKKVKVEGLWLIADKKVLIKLKKILALFRSRWREEISLYGVDLESKTIREFQIPEMNRLWREKPRKLKIPAEQFPSESAAEIIALAPGAIDVTYGAHGENLRFYGLPFARVRTLLGKERVWFGPAIAVRKRRVLDKTTHEEFFEFLEELKQNRNAGSENKTHYFYRASPEHWLESILRRDITQLDANLILSPIYHQFRASAGQIDLLALRRDGQLVVIELKVAPSREMVFQAADYWRQIELHRRSGNLAKARAFGDLEIADRPALVYLAAPALSFHPDLELWAGMLSPKIEMYRYALHENWRQNIKVLHRKRIG